MQIAQYIKNVDYLRKGKDGKDGENAILYKLVLDSTFLRQDGNGNWADGIRTSVIDGVECAQVLATFDMYDGNNRSVIPDICVLKKNDSWQLGVSYSTVIYVKPTDEHLHLALYKLDSSNPPNYDGNLLAENDIYIVKDGENGVNGDNGDKGDQGARCRQHEGFVESEYGYQCGENGDDFWDVVLIGKVWYRCIQSYTSTGKEDERNIPTSSSFSEYWSNKGMTNVDFIATTFFLAENGQINLLGTNEINLYDSDDNQFGSFRVPHVTSTDGNKYALWLGGNTGDTATFSVTKDGKIKAISGKIGSFDIETYTDSTDFKFYGLHSHTDGTATIPASTLVFDYEGLYVGSGLSTPGASVRIGWNGDFDDSEFSWRSGLVRADGNFGGSSKTGEQAAFNADMVGNGKNIMVGFEASAYNGADNRAFWARQGDFLSSSGLFRGLRPNIQVVEKNTTLTDMDNIIICSNSGDITLTFPTSPKKGQMYIVIQTAGNVYFNGNGKSFRGKLSGTNVNSKTRGQINFFFWDGSYWSCSYAS